MSEELVKVETSLATGGMGVDFGSKIFRLKPTTLTINQQMTQVEGAIPGNFRIVETGEEFKELTVVLIDMPVEQRQYHLGNEDKQKNKLNKSLENLVCYSRDMNKPDERSKMPQAFSCSSCQFSQWNNDVTPAVPPACDIYWFAKMIDTETQLPMKFFIRGISKKPFEQGMLNLSRTFRLLKAKGHNPNIFDISFKMSTEKYKNAAGQVNYKLKIDGGSFHYLKPEEAEKFGEIYLEFINRGAQVDDEPETENVETVNKVIEEEIQV